MNPSFFRPAALLLTLLAATVNLTACSSGFTESATPIEDGPFPVPPPDGPGAEVTARKFFLSSVGPDLQQSCASCHAHAASGAPVFLGETPEASYVILVLVGGLIAFPDNSLLSHYGTHAGPDITPDQRQLINTWLTLEMSERIGQPPPGASLADALPKIGTCMSQADWTANGLDALAKLDTGGSGICSDCHSGGTGGAFLSADANETFTQNRQFPFINRWVRGEIDATFAFQGFSSADGFTKTATESCDPKTFNCHPPYQLPQALSDGIYKFVDATLARWHGAACNLP